MKAIEVEIIVGNGEENEPDLILFKDRQARETRRSDYAHDRYGNHGRNPGKMEIRAEHRSRRRIMRAALATRCSHR